MWPIRAMDETTKQNVIRSTKVGLNGLNEVKVLLRDDRIPIAFLTGLSFAKLWVCLGCNCNDKHGVASPVFTADIWSTSEQWGLFALVCEK